MSDLIRFKAGLPSLALQIWPLEGENIQKQTLVLTSDAASAEDVVLKFRQRYAPERAVFYRRYYIQPLRRGGYSIKYAWNLDEHGTDLVVGKVKNDDLAAIKVIIGNNVAGAYMTPIRWDLCEDRDGEDVIEVGRFDPWSLLSDITEEDIERLNAKGVVPDLDRWDFDNMFLKIRCPGCGKNVKINHHAYNIDSAKCATCGKRPFLSKAVGKSMNVALPSVSGAGFQRLDRETLQLIGWLGCVNASAAELHAGDMPDQADPMHVLSHMLERANDLRLLAGDTVQDPGASKALVKLRCQPGGTDTLMVVNSAAQTLRKAMQTGGPFTEIHATMALLVEQTLRAAKT